MDWITNIAQDAAAPVIVCAMFIGFLVIAGRAFFAFMTNHMAKTTRALEDLVNTTTRLRDEIAEQRSVIDRCHEYKDR
jgi:hypothetical protein